MGDIALLVSLLTYVSVSWMILYTYVAFSLPVLCISTYSMEVFTVIPRPRPSCQESRPQDFLWPLVHLLISDWLRNSCDNHCFYRFCFRCSGNKFENHTWYISFKRWRQNFPEGCKMYTVISVNIWFQKIVYWYVYMINAGLWST